jgi:NADH:ubiquinone reductase (H+-translocating)
VEKNRPTRIVILGAGFAGIYAYLKLHKLLHNDAGKEIILVNEEDFFTFTPMIHEVATGTLLPFSITQSLRALPQCCLNRFVEGKIESIRADKKEVVVRHINPEAPPPGKGITEAEIERVSYDYCIMGLGSDVNFFGVEGAEEHALTLNSLKDARRVKNRIIESFELAQITKDETEKRRLLRFIIAGGGPTGVELAGEISDLVYGELKKAFPFLCPFVEIRLYESKSCFVAGMDAWFGTHAERILAGKKHVQLYCGKRVSKITAEGIHLGDEYVAAGTVIWTTGVQAREVSLLPAGHVKKDEKSRRIPVNSFLQIPAYPELFVAGDQAWKADKENGQPYPMRAQFAVREGAAAAVNVVRMMQKKELQEFYWNDMGFIISLGKGYALAYVFGIKLSGMPAWLVYRGAYLAKIVGVRAKLRTTLDWTLNTFLPRDISKL